MTKRKPPRKPTNKEPSSSAAGQEDARTIDATKLSIEELAYHLAPIGFGIYSAPMIGPPEKSKKKWIVEDGYDSDSPRRMIAFFNALRLLGPPEKIKKQLAAVRRTMMTNERIHKALPSLWTKKAQGETKSRLIELRGVLMRYVVMEEQIKKVGWRVHPKTGKLTRITKGRGADLLAEYVWHLFQGKYRDRGNTLKTRRQIAADLKRSFSAEDFDPGSGGVIYQAIRSRSGHSSDDFL